VLDLSGERGWGKKFPRCLITNGHMSCGSRFPLKRKRSFPILAVMPTLKLAGAPEKQAMIPWRGTGPLSRRRSLAGRECAHPYSTPYSVEQADTDPRHALGGESSFFVLISALSSAGAKRRLHPLGRSRTDADDRLRAVWQARAPIITRLDPDGSLSLRALAAKLTAEGLPPPAGAAVWTAATVARAKAKLAE
jgi:hypothetical protein